MVTYHNPKDGNTPLKLVQRGRRRKPVTFFDLPGEIRNDIYQLAAQDLVLTLAPPRKRASAKHAVRIPALFLTSRQARKECFPILLSTTPIEVRIANFDFQNLTRQVSSLYSSELKALRRNNHLTIRFTFPKPHKRQDCILDVWRWAAGRTDSLDRLPWRYICVPRLGPDGPSAEMQPDPLLIKHLRALFFKVEESVQWELQRIMDGVEGPILISQRYNKHGNSRG